MLFGAGGSGDRNTDEWHRLQWEQAEDEIGRQMLALFRDANALRKRFPALRRGGVSILHEVGKIFASLYVPTCDTLDVSLAKMWCASGAACCFDLEISIGVGVQTVVCSPLVSEVVFGRQS